MQLVNPGDVVFSFCDTLIKAVGIAAGKASAADRPLEFGKTGENWDKEGWLVPVQFTELASPLKPKDHIREIRPFLPPRYSPLGDDDNGLQNVYLASVPDQMAAVLVSHLSGQVEAILVAAALGSVAVAESLADQTEAEIKANSDIPETEKEQLIKARRGQGLYRSRLESVEAGCRVTGVTAKEHLRASHIKPWRSCDNREKLDGNNGFLLAPHIDHLFDRGYISFEDDGSILLSPGLDYSLLTQWKLDLSKNVGKFNRQQKAYLDYHRQSVFQR